MHVKLRILNEDIAAVKKYYPNIDDNTFMQLIQLDPTYKDGSNSVGKYGKWILNLFNKGNLSQEDFSDVTPLLNQFSTYRNRVPNKDLNSYKTLDDLESILADVVDDDSMLSDRQKLRFMKNVKAGRVKVSAEDDYDVVLNTPKFTVYVPNTHEASMKLGSGTKWCTAHENPEWYDRYTKENHKLYIVLNKESGDRWQYSDMNDDFLNSEDKKFSVPSLLKKDKDLSAFFSRFLGFDVASSKGVFTYDGVNFPADCVKNSIKQIIILDGVKHVNPYVFENCKKVTSITIPDSVLEIKYCAFTGCEKLNNLVVPGSVSSIGNSAFSGCINLSVVELKDGVQSIGNRTFDFCPLTDIKMPNSVRSIGKEVFGITPNDDLIVYTDNEYVKKYCLSSHITVSPENQFIRESIDRQLKLSIKEDTCCITSKTSYMDSGLDDNGIYYFGKKPEKPMNWKDYKQKKVKLERIDSTMVKKLRESDEMMTIYLTVDSKSVPDSDGFMTDYTWYVRIRCTVDEWYRWLKSRSGYNTHSLGDIPDEFIDGYVFVFGDSDLYAPEDGDFDFECDTYEEASEWFDDYHGLDDDYEDTYY